MKRRLVELPPLVFVGEAWKMEERLSDAAMGCVFLLQVATMLRALRTSAPIASMTCSGSCCRRSSSSPMTDRCPRSRSVSSPHLSVSSPLTPPLILIYLWSVKLIQNFHMLIWQQWFVINGRQSSMLWYNQAITFLFILNVLPNCPCNSLANSGHVVHNVFCIDYTLYFYFAGHWWENQGAF
jgi:hypothetical protein